MTAQTNALHLANALRDGVSYDEAEIESELRRLVAQRDALLEALKKLDNFFETYRPEDHPVSDPHELVRAAIKKAEENT